MSSNVFRSLPGATQVPLNSGLRVGIVKEQDPSLCRLRVGFNEFDQMLSYWLPVVVPKTQNDKAYWLPDIGEQVICLMDERDESGVVLGAIYSQADATPVQSTDKYHLGFKDGTSVEYDRAAHVLALGFHDTTAIKYDSGAHILALEFQDTTAIKYDGGAHVLTFSFEDQAAIRYDSGMHSLVIDFSDGTVIRYDAAAHAFSLLGGVGASVTMEASAGITLQSGTSYVTILPTGVTVNPPLV